MTRLLRAGGVVVAVLVASGCGAKQARPDLSVRVPPDLPPTPATWPSYPSFPATSCWTRPFPEGPPLRTAPSEAVPRHPQRVAPEEIVRRLLARFGDRRYIRRIELGDPPPITLRHLRAYFAGARPPVDAVWAYVGARAVVRAELSQWEAGLVTGALRDDFCAAGGAPLVGWTIGGHGVGLSDRSQALEQRFPNPSPAAFRARIALVGRRFGFSVQELRLLRPRQLAPLLVVHTDRDRKAFARDVPAIMRLLDPISVADNKVAATFEGFYFEAVDGRGSFVRIDHIYRGENEGSEWAWSRCSYPYPHSEPLGAKPCG